VLGNSTLDQLRQRITAAYHLGPLNEPDTRGYIEHRLRCAGWKGDPEIADDCFPAIFRYTGGVPRRINSLCSRLLLLGFIEESHALTRLDTEQVASELDAELSAVATSNIRPNGAGVPASVVHNASGLEAICERLDNVERMTASHGRVIRRM